MKQKVLVEIMKIIEGEGAQFAFPTSTTYVTQEDGKSLRLSLSGDNRDKPLTPE